MLYIVKKKGKGKGTKKVSLLQYSQIPNEDKKGLRDLTDDQKKDVFGVCEVSF